MNESVPAEPFRPADDVTHHVGYLLKRAQAALRGAMDKVLREYGLTVPQYATLELLAQHPGMSNADLARATFVTRQSGNVVLRGLQEAGLIDPPRHRRPGQGPARPPHRRGPVAPRRGPGRRVRRRSSAWSRAMAPRRVTSLLADLDHIASALEG